MRFYQTQCESFEGVTILPNLPTFGMGSWMPCPMEILLHKKRQAVPGALRAHAKTTSHFIRRCIPLGCVAKTRNIQIFLRFRALPSGRLNA